MKLLYFKFPNLKSTCKAVRIAAVCIWNLLPLEIREINYSKNKFKKELHKWLLTKDNDSDSDLDTEIEPESDEL